MCLCVNRATGVLPERITLQEFSDQRQILTTGPRIDYNQYIDLVFFCFVSKARSHSITKF